MQISLFRRVKSFLSFNNTFLKYPKYFSVQLTFDINHKSQQDKQPWLSPSRSLCQLTHRRQVEENNKALQLWLFALFSVTNLFWLLLWVAHLVVIQVTLLWILSVTVPQTFNEKVITMWAGEQNILANGQGGGGGNSFWVTHQADKEMPVALNADMCHLWRYVQGTQDRAAELGDKFGI